MFLLSISLVFLQPWIVCQEIVESRFFTTTTTITTENMINITEDCISEQFLTQSITECILQCNIRKLKTPVWENQRCYCLKEDCKTKNFFGVLKGNKLVKQIN